MASNPKKGFADKKMIGRAISDSFIKLNPKTQAQNPVMLLVYISAILTTILWIIALCGLKDASAGYTLAIAIILWFTVLFANFAEAIAEGRGKAQADSLRAAKKDVEAHKIPSADQKDAITVVSSATLKKGDIVIVQAGEQIPADGEIIEGAASVDESAITGESAPVIRESGGDRSAVTGGTTVLSDWIVVQVTSDAGESFLDKMIAMVEGAARKKTPNEIALQIFLVALSIIFILVTVSLYTYSVFSANQAGIENPTSVTTLVALLVCLAPTTIGALLSAIGIAGMSRLNQANVLAMSGRAIEAAGDVDILMLDKTGTITYGNRQAHEFVPVDGASIIELADAAYLSSLSDETPEGRSIVALAKEKYGVEERTISENEMTFIPFTAKTRMSGVDYHGVDNTLLTGDGANLSQGQRQLLAIARAAIADPPVLILDEATSSIDTRTEKIVQDGMDKLMAGRTTFVIAHRLSTVKNSDCIIVLEQGRVIERGNHDKLMEEKGKYYQLYTGNLAEG